MSTEINRRDVQRLMERGAQIVDVLEAAEYDDSHLPGAIHIPLPKLPAQAATQLNTTDPVVVYCYDSVCDLSSRAAARLESLGFTDVYDFVGSKMEWIGAGLPFDGARAKAPHLGTLADRDVPTCLIGDAMHDVRAKIGTWDICVVVDDRNVVLGLVRAEAAGLEDDRPVADVMQEAPRTYRPYVNAAELRSKVKQPWVLVTNLDGTLVGVVRPEQLSDE